MRIKELYLYVISIILIVAIVSMIIIPAAHNDAYSKPQEYQRDANPNNPYSSQKKMAFPHLLLLLDNQSRDLPGIPKVIWTFEPGVKTPVTDLAGCISSVLDCVESGTALKDCFGTKVTVCTGEVPTDGCCMQACGDLLAQGLNSGMNEQDAYLEVLVNDGSCMPNIEKGTYQ